MTPGQLMQVVRDALGVLTTRDGIELSNAVVDERARNIAQAVLCELDVEMPPDPSSSLFMGVVALEHVWVSQPVFYDSQYDGDHVPKGRKTYAVMQLRCRRCGLMPPEGVVPRPAWAHGVPMRECR